MFMAYMYDCSENRELRHQLVIYCTVFWSLGSKQLRYVKMNYYYRCFIVVDCYTFARLLKSNRRSFVMTLKFGLLGSLAL